MWIRRCGEGGSGSVKESLGGGAKLVEIIPQPMTRQFAFCESPDPLDEIELRTIRGEPLHTDAVGVIGEPGAERCRLVIGRIVEHQHQVVVCPACRELVEKRVELLGIARRC